MLQNIEPHRTRSRAGSLTEEEKSFAKALFIKGYVEQDIVFIINQGRNKTVNQSVVHGCKNRSEINPAKEDELNHFLKIQSSYDPITLLNPYKDARLIRAREAMISAVQLFNSPATTFKTEVFSVLANIAWTYLIHEKMEQSSAGSSQFKNGKSISVSWVLDRANCPVEDKAVKENLKTIIKIRDAVEHTFFVGEDEYFGHVFQACCINFDKYLTKWFGGHLTLSKQLSLALQFVKLDKNQITEIEKSNFPAEIKALKQEIENNHFSNNNAYRLNVYFTTEVSSKTNSDLHKLITHDDNSNATEIAIKRQRLTLRSEGEIVTLIQAEGFKNFTPYEHQQFWKTKWATANERQKKAHEYGEKYYQSGWLWYKETWLPEVFNYCESQGDKFR